ncbi:MAG: hypothetical protein GY795_24345 [Desulfobacterales bacterium]|nr:hypothetical protein [Desulfobacterales bacterium]
MNSKIIILSATVLVCLYVSPISADTLQITDLESGLTPVNLVDYLLDKGVEVSNVTFTGANLAAGYFDGGEDSGIGLTTGVILSSGRVADVIGPNNNDSTSNSNGQPGDDDLNVLINGITNDAAVLEFDFVPVGKSISFRYVMGSDEYPEYLSYSDVFGFFLNGENIALLPETTTSISITNVNHQTNSEYYVSNSPTEHNIQCDGFTVVLEVLANVTPGKTHHIKLAVADKGDSAYDTWVFIEGGSFISGTDVAVNVIAPAEPQLNESAKYSVVVSNLGSHTAEDVEAIIRLPDTVIFNEASITQGTWSEENGTLTCNIGTMEKGESVVINVSVQVKSLPIGICIAQVSSSSFDLDFTNNNDPEYYSPIAKDDLYSAVEGNLLSVDSETGVLSNDESVSVYGETAELVSNVSHGLLILNSDGSFKYTPDAGYVGKDFFTYRVFDNISYSDAATVTITVTEQPFDIAFSSSNYTIQESHGNIEITVTLSDTSSNPITVDYATSNGTASAGSDYMTATGTLTFNPGELSKTLTVSLLDSPDEQNETFYITLSNPVNAGLGTPKTCQVTITRHQAVTSITYPNNGDSFVDTEIAVRGNTESGAFVEIFVNNVSQGTAIATSAGNFSLAGVQLSTGENSITAVATNPYGVTSPASEAVVVTLVPRPQAPVGLAATPGDTVATLIWNSSSEPDIQGYYVYRDDTRLNYNLITGTTLKDTRLTNGKTYKYTVTAVNVGEIESFQSSAIMVTPLAGTGWQTDFQQ